MNLHNIASEIENAMIELGEMLADGKNPSIEKTAELLGMNEDFDAKVVDYHHVITNLTLAEDAHKKEIAKLTTQKKQLADNIERVKGALLFNMQKLNKTKAGDDVYKVRVVDSNYKLVINDDSNVPDKYKTTQEITTIDKKAMNKDREQLQGIDGIEFVRGQYLRIN